MGAQEIRAIADELRRHIGTDHITPSYIATILRAAGKRVTCDVACVDLLSEEAYASRLKGVLRFRDFASAEASLREIDAIYREYREVSDRIGTSLVRSLVEKGRRSAESLAANPRLRLEKRREKQEIARWFRVWLETSDLLFDWLEMRKSSEEFRELFPGRNGIPK